MNMKTINYFSSWDQTLQFTGHKAPQVDLFYDPSQGLQVKIKAPLKNTKRLNAPEGRLWGLWEHEVIEIFIAGANGTYLELEFGPWGHYLALSLDGIRKIKNDRCLIKDYHVSQTFEQDHQQQMWLSSCFIEQIYLPKLLSTHQKSPHNKKVYWGCNAFWCFQENNHKTLLKPDNNELVAQHAHKVDDQQRRFCCAYPLPGLKPDFHQPQYFPRWFPLK